MATSSSSSVSLGAHELHEPRSVRLAVHAGVHPTAPRRCRRALHHDPHVGTRRAAAAAHAEQHPADDGLGRRHRANAQQRPRSRRHRARVRPRADRRHDVRGRQVRAGAPPQHRAHMPVQPWLAAFNLDTGVWVRTFLPQLDGAVFDLAATPDNKLLVAGNFTNIDSVANTAGLAEIDPTTGSRSPAGRHRCRGRSSTAWAPRTRARSTSAATTTSTSPVTSRR